MLVCSISWEHCRPIVDGNESLEPLPVTAVGGANVRNQAQILKCLHVALDGAGRLPELPCQPCCSNRFIFGVILRDTKRQQFIDKSLSFS